MRRRRPSARAPAPTMRHVAALAGVGHEDRLARDQRRAERLGRDDREGQRRGAHPRLPPRPARRQPAPRRRPHPHPRPPRRQRRQPVRGRDAPRRRRRRRSSAASPSSPRASTTIPTASRSAVAAFLRRRVDGLILTTVSESQAYLAPELRRGTPVVFVDREPAGITSDAVVSDNADGAAVATRHLLEHGHRSVAYLGDRRVHPDGPGAPPRLPRGTRPGRRRDPRRARDRGTCTTRSRARSATLALLRLARPRRRRSSAARTS